MFMQYFREISRIPRESGNTKPIQKYLVEFAASHKLFCIVDSAGNVIIKKQPSYGYEDDASILLQCHMDMVCVSEKEYDFSRDGIRLLMQEDFLYADGTSLGADNGIAMAYFLEILADNSILHPPLEVAFTVDEETGMYGALGMEMNLLESKYCINLDSEREGIIIMSSAGGIGCHIPLELEYQISGGILVNLEIKGLQGGHSGVDIHKNRENAILFLGRLLLKLKKKISYQVITLQGGTQANSIPKEACAQILIQPHQMKELTEFMEHELSGMKKEYQVREPEISFAITDFQDYDGMVLTEACFHKILLMLVALPNGVQVMHQSIPDMVESSVNLGMMKMDQEQICFTFSIRSSVNHYKEFIYDKLSYIAGVVQADCIITSRYEAWEYDPDSKLRDIAVKCYYDLYEKEPKLEAIHAGLECSIITNRIKNCDVISIGPDIMDVHTVHERVSINSAKRVFHYLVYLLEQLQFDQNEND